MPQLNKNFTSGKMNKDADERVIPAGQYRHAENINVINSETSENAGAAKNVLSNKKLTNFSFTGTAYNITPNPLVYEARNRIYWLCKDDVGCYLFEYDINNQTLNFVLSDTRPTETRVLNLNEKFLVTGINILKTEDENKELILWTDNNMQPCCVNIKRAKTWAVNGFDEEDILLIKKPPRYAPRITPIATNDKSNNLEDKFLSFCYRYKYLDGEYSALSSYTYYNFSPKKFELDFFTLVNKGFVNKFNAVNIEFNTGDHRVVEIQLVYKETSSNTLYVIETFNKVTEGIPDNETRSFVFSNQKTYKALPENELYRLFDNVPLKAKAQTLINNFIVYSNYVEFFNLKDIYGNDIVIDYDISLINENIDNEIILLNNIPQPNIFTIQNAAGVLYKKDYVLFLFFSININNILVYENEFYFILPQDYISIIDLVSSPEFISFVEVIKSHFSSNYNSENEYDIDPDYAINTDTSIDFEIISGIPTFKVNPIIFEDTANSNAIVTVDLKFNSQTTAGITSIQNTSSCKTNKNYEVGIQYIYKYNRSTIALTSKNNTIFIPQEFSIFKNKLRVTLNNLPPVDAIGYKFVIKTNPLLYQTIYINEFYNEDNYVWAKLQADNKDKIKTGDNLILKVAGNTIGVEPKKIKVLEIKEFEKDFLENEDENGNPIIETAGVYMKIRPDGFSMDLDDYEIKQNQVGDIGSSRFPTCYLDLFTETNFTAISSELAISQGSSIYIMINSSRRYESGWKNIRYEKTFFAQRDYATLENWFNENLLNGNFIAGIDLQNGETNDYSDNLELVRGQATTSSPGSYNIQLFTPNPNGKLYLKVDGLLSGGSNDRKGFCRAEIIIRNSTGIYVFETEPKQADTDIFFETEETFDIVNGEHVGSEQYPIVQPQNNTTFQPAIIDLNFFNCYAQGNGVESYRVRDEFNTKFLNIDLRPTTTSVEPYRQIRKFADVTHCSEPYNESSNINGLNNFNLATANFKELDKQYGSIQLIHNKLNDILVLQEEKAGKINFGKQAIYTADGEPVMVNISEILGDYVPYQGNNGIGLNPESFAQDNFRFYWFNTYFGVPIRLSIDGTTEINDGMVSEFRNLAISNRNAIKIGAFDTFNKLYTLHFGDEPITIDYFNCGNVFEKKITEEFSYILNLNNQIGQITLNYEIVSGNVNITTTLNEVTENHDNLTGTGNIVVERNTLNENQLVITITPNSNSIVKITNLCPMPVPLDIVLVVLGDELDAGKTILNRFRTNLNSFVQYEDTFLENPITKFETISGFEGQLLFPINGDTITIQAVKRQINTGSFLKNEECNRIKYLISNQAYDTSNVYDLLDDATNLVLTETIQGINQNTFTGSFEFNRLMLDEKLYLIWDYTNRKPIANDDNITLTEIGQTQIINVLENDNQNGSSVTVTIVTEPTYGTATVNLDNTITYEHDGTANLTDSFSYQLSNGVCNDVATVNIQVINAEENCFKLVNALYTTLDIGEESSVNIEYNLCSTNSVKNENLPNNQTVTIENCVIFSSNFGLYLSTQINIIEIQQSITNNSFITKTILDEFDVPIGFIKLKFANCI
jgi:hypothetical protein